MYSGRAKRLVLFRLGAENTGCRVSIGPGWLGSDDCFTKFRKQKLLEYFQKLGTSIGDETLAALLDVIACMHTPNKGNPLLSVPLVQIAALLGFMSDQFMSMVDNLEVTVAERKLLRRAYNKLFWVQNNLFIRHYTPH